MRTAGNACISEDGGRYAGPKAGPRPGHFACDSVAFAARAKVCPSEFSYREEDDEHLRQHRRSRCLAQPRQSKTPSLQPIDSLRCKSVLQMIREARARRDRDVLASNARARRDAFQSLDLASQGTSHPMISSSTASESPSRGGVLSDALLASASPALRKLLSQSSKQQQRSQDRNEEKDADSFVVPAEHANKLRILENMFDAFDARDAAETARIEDEHHRIQCRLLSHRPAFRAESEALRLQFVARTERRAFREKFPKLRRASSLRSLSAPLVDIHDDVN